MAMVKHDGPTLARVSRTNGRKRGKFSRNPARRVSPLELSSKLGREKEKERERGGAKDNSKGLSPSDTRERKRLSFENVKQRGWIKRWKSHASCRPTSPTLYGLSLPPPLTGCNLNPVEKRHGRVSQQSGDATGCWQLGRWLLQLWPRREYMNSWREAAVYGPLSLKNGWTPIRTCHPAAVSGAAATFRACDGCRTANGHLIRDMELDFSPRTISRSFSSRISLNEISDKI